MNWFYALNGEQQGPVTSEQLDQLLGQGVINDATLVWREGLATWQPLASARPASTVPPVPADAAAGTNPAPPVGGTVRCAECQGLFPESEVARFGDQAVCAGCKPRFLQRLAEGLPPPRPTAGRSVNEILGQRLELNLNRHWTRAWQVLGQRPVFLLAMLAVGYLIIMAASAIPILSLVAPILVQGPLLGGMFLVLLRLLRGQAAEFGNLFDGFRRGYWQLVLVQLVQTLITAALVVPIALVGVTPLVVAFIQAQQSGQSPLAGLGIPLIALSVVSFLAMMVVGLLAGATWMFSIPLVADRGMQFWPAMELSRKLAWRRLGTVVLFVVALGLLNLAGMLVACVGLLVTGPVSALMAASFFDDAAGDLNPDKA